MSTPKFDFQTQTQIIPLFGRVAIKIRILKQSRVYSVCVWLFISL